MTNGDLKNGIIDTKISLGQIAIVATVVASTLVFYFSGQNNVGERISKMESDLNSRIVVASSQQAERMGKLEIRTAVIEQHQAQEDAGIADARTNLNSFIVDVRQQLNKIFEQVSDLRPTGRDGQGNNNRGGR